DDSADHHDDDEHHRVHPLAADAQSKEHEADDREHVLQHLHSDADDERGHKHDEDRPPEAASSDLDRALDRRDGALALKHHDDASDGTHHVDGEAQQSQAEQR